jgi:Papain family cysteine protease
MTSGDVYKHLRVAGGLATRDAYPDAYMTGFECLWNYTMDGIQLLGDSGYERIPSNDESQLLKAVRFKGPVSTMFYVTAEFFSYRDGIYTGNPNCIPGAGIPHALLIVGYGTDKG